MHGPLLGWSIRFTTEFAPDILAACRQRHEHLHHWPVTRRNVLGSDVRQLLAERVDRHPPLPGRNGQVNAFFLAKVLGCSREVLAGLAGEVEQAAAIVGLTDWTTYEFAITGRMGTRPWISGIAVGDSDPDSLAELSRLLQAACYVIIAFLSGMRDSEVKHLRRGCLQVIRDADGRPYRWKLASLAFKGERDPAGLRDFGERARFRGSVITDRRQLERLMQRDDPAIYPGTYATCVFNPDKALCQQQHDAHGKPRPSLGHCKPLDCRNTALTAGNRTALAREATDITLQLASRPVLPPLLQARLSDRRDQITAFLCSYPETS